MPGRVTNPAPTETPTLALQVAEPLCAVFRRKLRSEGLKYTPERAQVLDTIVRHDGIFEADTIIEKVKGTGIRVSKATVYRTIKLLQEAGVIQRVLFDGELAHYQLVYGQSPKQLLVQVDGTMAIEVEVPGLDALCREVAASRGVRLSGYRLQIFVEKP